MVTVMVPWALGAPSLGVHFEPFAIEMHLFFTVLGIEVGDALAIEALDTVPAAVTVTLTVTVPLVKETAPTFWWGQLSICRPLSLPCAFTLPVPPAPAVPES